MAGQSQPGRSEQSRRLAQYDDLIRFASAVNAERSFEDLFEFVTREAASVMRADRASIFLLNPDKQEPAAPPMPKTGAACATRYRVSRAKTRASALT